MAEDWQLVPPISSENHQHAPWTPGEPMRFSRDMVGSNNRRCHIANEVTREDVGASPGQVFVTTHVTHFEWSDRDHAGAPWNAPFLTRRVKIVSRDAYGEKDPETNIQPVMSTTETYDENDKLARRTGPVDSTIEVRKMTEIAQQASSMTEDEARDYFTEYFRQNPPVNSCRIRE